MVEKQAGLFGDSYDTDKWSDGEHPAEPDKPVAAKEKQAEFWLGRQDDSNQQLLIDED